MTKNEEEEINRKETPSNVISWVFITSIELDNE